MRLERGREAETYDFVIRAYENVAAEPVAMPHSYENKARAFERTLGSYESDYFS
jgi:hypothetical protein